MDLDLIPLLTNLIICVTTFLAVLAGLAVAFLHHQHCKYDHIPGPNRDSFWMGNVPHIRKRMAAGEILPAIFLEWSKQHGHTFVIHFIHLPVIFTCEPEAIKDLLVTGGHPKAKRSYGFMTNLYGVRFLGRGLFTEVDHERWRKRRLAIDPAFRMAYMKSAVPDFNQCADAMMEKLSAAADDQTTVAMRPMLNRVALDILGKVAFGKDIDSVHDDSVQFPRAIFKTLEGFAKYLQNPTGRFQIFGDGQFKQEVGQSLQYLRDTGQAWIEERRLAMSRGQHVPDDILTSILNSHELDSDLSTEEVLDDFMTFFTAGQETSANSVSFTVMELARRPDVLNKLREEVDVILGSKPYVSYEDLGRLEYCSMVVKETLRLYPPGPFTFREVVNDHMIGGYLVPKHTSIFMSPFVSGRQPDFHSKPDEFIPERFADQSPDRPTVYTYLPFSRGPRNCLGQNFARIEAKIILAKLVQRFNVQLHPSQSFNIMMNATIRPKDDVLCTLTYRE